MIGAFIRRQRFSGQKEGEGVCQGFGVFMYDKKDNGRLKDRLLSFGHPSADLCNEWCERIKNLLDGKYKAVSFIT